MPKFKEILAGAYAIEKHLQSDDLAQNFPVLLGLVGVWSSTSLEVNVHTVLNLPSFMG